MKTRLPWLLLIVSVAFNIFAAIGFIQAREQARRDVELAQTPRGRADMLARQLELTPDQHRRYEQLQEQMDKQRTSRAPQKDAFFRELIKDNPDQKALESYFVGPEVQQRRLERLKMMRQLVEILTPQQRARFVQLIKERDAASK